MTFLTPRLTNIVNHRNLRILVILLLQSVVILPLGRVYAQTFGPINGPTSVYAGTATSYSVNAVSGATAYDWLLSSGGTISGSGTSISVQWQSSYSGSATLTCKYHDSSGHIAGATTATITVQIPSVTPGTISPSSQSINSGVSATLTGTAATGGNGVYSYQWQSSSSSGGTYTNITGATSVSYSTPVLTTTTYYKRTDISNGSSGFTNVAAVTVLPALLPGNVTPASQNVLFGVALNPLTSTAATGGNGSYTYQWQSSSDNSTNWTNISGATGLTYNPGTAYNTAYYRLSVTSNNQTLYTNSSAVIITNCAALNTNPPASMNYIVSSTFREPGITSAITDAQIAGMGICAVNQTIQYFDGLGRPIQTVQVKGSPTERDVVQPMAYDQFGREAIKYLPYTATPATSDGRYQAAAISNQVSFYTNPTNATWNAPGVTKIATNSGNVTYSQTGYEPSPLNRVVEQGYPGGAWQISGDGDANSSSHTTRLVYATNDQASTFDANNITNNTGSKIVAEYGTIINATTSTQSLVRLATSYGPGQLYVSIARDENWQPGGNDCIYSTEEYKDKEGHVVLKRTYNETTVSGVSTMQMLSTYYVYDDYGNLAFVIPPQAQGDNGGVPSQSVIDNLCYQYHYDGRNRLVEKKIPGRGWDYIIYNKLDQVVFTQDSVQRMKSPQQGSFTKFDALGRPVTTGFSTLADCSSCSTTGGGNNRAAIQARVDAETTLWEKMTTAGSYTTQATFPASGATKLVVNFYDNYTFAGLPANYTPPSGSSQMTQGLPTATQVSVLNTPADKLWTVNYYDDLGRTIQTYKQHYLGGHASYSTNNYDAITTGYNFSNQPVAVTRQHYTSANTTTPAVTINNTYVYDHAGRKTQTYESINGGTNILLSQTDYNEVGQLLDKQFHSTDNGSTFLQTVTYAYNARGWLQKSAAPLFTEQLQYNANSLGIGGNFAPQYNGNIASQTWTNGSGGVTDNYIYLYDNLNRLVSGNSPQTKNNENSITYDLNGNITGLKRYMGSTTSAVDQLTYTYTDASSVYRNQLQTITDATTNDQGLKHGTFTYAYDANGNITADNSKGLAISAYNILNLPQTMTISGTGGGTITYVYDANGDKLRKSSTIGTASSTDYISGIEYDNSALTFIQTEEGRAIPTSNGFNYEYNLSDHLGNVRLSFDSQTTPGTATVVQQDDYMPFGMDLSIATTSPSNNYLYNKKELQQETNLYDYGARFYDPVIGRFSTTDVYAEKYSSLSPYQYGALNPIKNIDMNGDSVWTTVDKNKKGRITGYTTHITGRVINEASGRGISVNDVANGINDKLNSQSYTDPKTGLTYKISANFQGADNLDEVSTTDNLLVMVDKVTGSADKNLGGGQAGGIAEMMGEVAYVGYEGSTLNTTIDDFFHEIGHNLGLGHPDPKDLNYANDPMGYASTGNGKPFSGNQMLQIYTNVDYFEHSMNFKHYNRSIITVTEPFFNGVSTNEKPYSGNWYQGERIPLVIKN